MVVADDVSTDGSVEELRRRFPGVRVFAHPERRGTATTKDFAARQARGDVLVFLDAHCKPEPGAIARLVEDVEALQGRAVVTPRVPALDVGRWENQMHQVGHGFRVDLETFACGWVGLERMTPHGEAGGRPLYASPSLIACCAAMSREAYEALRGFDRGLYTWGLEDLDFGLKAWLTGYPVLHDPEPVIGHRFQAGFAGYTVPTEDVVANKLRIARKHFSDPVWEDWLGRARVRQPDWPWEAAWALFEAGRDGLGREREYLLSRRAHDEFWFAERFGLSWPPASLSGRFAPRVMTGPPPPGADPPAHAAPGEEPAED